MIVIAPATFTTWADMRSRVLRKAPECPNFRLDDALKEVAREFLTTTQVWRMARGTLLTTVADTLTYAYVPPNNGEVCAVISAWNGDTELDVIVPGEQDEDEPSEISDDYKVGVRFLDTLYLSHKPLSAGVDIEGVLAFTTSETAAGIPEDVWRQWGEEIACGAAAMLVTEPAKPWSNPNTYQFLRGRFEDGMSDASNSAGPVRRKPMRVKVW